ncbi:DUF6510 family protein [Actinomadura sp. BRA 177]|uniref:DUF6510 family protein n=1 Tax=Actinomadura sp. BRA 177 TaxID=2745202 RepID=UPI001595C690|nr:DUF6510 family protein [Actinomadura sp. BRA 177]NVI90070.1 hypothetical protein [Actinomadura sp. BRA 177]
MAILDDRRDAFTDGNAIAGPLAEIFAVDVTAAESRCAGCGRTGPVAALRVYGRAPGFVARCPGCDHIVLRLVRGPGTVWLDMRGTIALAVPVDG